MTLPIRRHPNGVTMRVGRGLNSFVTRQSKRNRISDKPMYQDNDPQRYHVRGLVCGSFEIVDRNTGKVVASQLDSHDEAQGWIDEQVKA